MKGSDTNRTIFTAVPVSKHSNSSAHEVEGALTTETYLASNLQNVVTVSDIFVKSSDEDSLEQITAVTTKLLSLQPSEISTTTTFVYAATTFAASAKVNTADIALNAKVNDANIGASAEVSANDTVVHAEISGLDTSISVAAESADDNFATASHFSDNVIERNSEACINQASLANDSVNDQASATVVSTQLENSSKIISANTDIVKKSPAELQEDVRTHYETIK